MPLTLKYILIISILLSGLIIGGYFIGLCRAKSVVTQYLLHIEAGIGKVEDLDSTIVRAPLLTDSAFLYRKHSDTVAIKRVTQLGIQVRNNKRFYGTIAHNFHAHSMVSLTASLVLGIIAAILLIIITREGWAQANPVYILLFFIIFGFATLFKGIIEVFELEKNYSICALTFLKYSRLENEICNYLYTGSANLSQNEQDTLQSQKINPEDFIFLIDRKMGIINQTMVNYRYKDLNTFINQSFEQIEQK